MLQTIRLSNFKIEYIDFEKNKDYNLIITFIPQTDEEMKWGNNTTRFVVSHTFGIIDTTITDDKYFCTLLYDDSAPIIGTDRAALFAFFTKKIEKPIKNIEINEPAKLTQITDNKINQEFRGVKSPYGKSYLNVGDDLSELVSGDNKISISNNQISLYGNIVDYNLPTKSQGGLFKETGIMRFLPKCFIPPFSIPDYVPDTDFILKTAKFLNVIKKLSEEIGG